MDDGGGASDEMDGMCYRVDGMKWEKYDEIDGIGGDGWNEMDGVYGIRWVGWGEMRRI